MDNNQTQKKCCKNCAEYMYYGTKKTCTNLTGSFKLSPLVVPEFCCEDWKEKIGYAVFCTREINNRLDDNTCEWILENLLDAWRAAVDMAEYETESFSSKYKNSHISVDVSTNEYINVRILIPETNDELKCCFLVKKVSQSFPETTPKPVGTISEILDTYKEE